MLTSDPQDPWFPICAVISVLIKWTLGTWFAAMFEEGCFCACFSSFKNSIVCAPHRQRMTSEVSSLFPSYWSWGFNSRVSMLGSKHLLGFCFCCSLLSLTWEENQRRQNASQVLSVLQTPISPPHTPSSFDLFNKKLKLYFVDKGKYLNFYCS